MASEEVALPLPERHEELFFDDGNVTFLVGTIKPLKQMFPEAV